jgi:hypothetical protein
VDRPPLAKAPDLEEHSPHAGGADGILIQGLVTETIVRFPAKNGGITIEPVPNDDELAIVLRGDLAAIRTFACGKKDPAFLDQAAVLKELMGEAAGSDVHKRKKPREGGSL